MNEANEATRRKVWQEQWVYRYPVGTRVRLRGRHHLDGATGEVVRLERVAIVPHWGEYPVVRCDRMDEAARPQECIIMNAGEIAFEKGR